MNLYKHSSYEGYYPKVLVVDDEASIVNAVNLIFAKMGWQTHNAFDGETARAILYKNDYDLIILDWNLPDMQGNNIIMSADVDFRGTKKKKIPIITYTRNKFKDLARPNLRNFAFVDHWQKPMVFAEICQRASKISRWR